ncbi:DoxX family membrane protein [Candidatus Uhrbacteria bacterium]|nr:DoxX family membrane protein [Candidatus Uhrbacteria bacterium]
MTSFAKISLFLLRLGVGWFMLYAGITKVLNPEWSAAGYLKGAKTFAGLYQWFAQPDILPIINFINEWGLTLLGVSLLLGIFVRLSSVLGAVLMLLYYFPVLQFPIIPPHSYIVDDHIINALVLVVLASMQAGRVWGLDSWCARLPLCSRCPRIRSLFG